MARAWFGPIQLGIALGFLGAFVLVFLIFSRVFPTLPLPAARAARAAPPPGASAPRVANEPGRRRARALRLPRAAGAAHRAARGRSGCCGPRPPSALARGRGHAFTRYEDVTHVARLAPRPLARHAALGLHASRARRFVDPLGARARCCARCSSGSPRGRAAASSSRASTSSTRRAQRRAPPRATFGLAALCVVVFVFQAFTLLPIFEARLHEPAAGARRRSAPARHREPDPRLRPAPGLEPALPARRWGACSSARSGASACCA